MRRNIINKIKAVVAQPEYVFIIPAIIFGLLSTIIIPQLISNDENMHFLRGYQLTELQVSHTCQIPKDIRNRGFDDMYTKNPNYSFEVDRVNFSEKITTNCGSATSYNPLMHLPQAIGIMIAKIINPSTGFMILFGRIANLLVYCIGLFYIIRWAKIGKWLIVIVGLMPTMIHGAASLSGDVMNNLIVIGFIVYILNIFTQKNPLTKKQIVALLVASMLVACTKMTNIVLLLPMLFLPSRLFSPIYLGKKQLPNFAIRISLLFTIGVTAVAVLAVWFMAYGNLPNMGAGGAANPFIEKPLLFLKIFYNTYINPDILFGGVVHSDWLLRGVIGSFSSFRYHLPYYMVILVTILIVLIGLRRDKAEERRVAIAKMSLPVVSAMTLVALLVVMTYGLYVAWSIQPFVLGAGAQYAQGLQGRYFTPLILLLVPLMIATRKYIHVEIKSNAAVGVLIIITMSLALLFYTIQSVTYVIPTS